MSNELKTIPKDILAPAPLDDTRTIVADILRGRMPVDAFIGEMKLACGGPGVVNCTAGSKVDSIQYLATHALSIAAGHAVLIPRGRECTVNVQWQGYKTLMERHPSVRLLRVHLIHKTDRYEYDGDKKQIVNHEYNPVSPQRSIESLDDLLGGYLEIVWTDPDTPPTHHVVTVNSIKKAKGCAQTPKIWNAWPEQMAIKTVFRDAFARRIIPYDPWATAPVVEATKADDKALANDPRQAIEHQPESIGAAGQVEAGESSHSPVSAATAEDSDAAAFESEVPLES